MSLGVQIAFLAAYLVLKYLDKRREREEKFAQKAQVRTIKEELGQLDSKLP